MNRPTPRRSPAAFTLVELLVVIGIIALLISILLPALNRARAHANLIDCQSRLRQIGQAMHIYTAQNKGLLPWGGINHAVDTTQKPAGTKPLPSGLNEQWWKWHYTLSEILTPGLIGDSGWIERYSPVFEDKDTIPGRPWGWRDDYTANPRVFTQHNERDEAPAVLSNYASPPVAKEDRTQRNISTIANASQVMAVWDAPQGTGYGNNAFDLAISMDGWMLFWGHAYVTGSPFDWVSYDRAIPPGSEGGNTDGRALQKQRNRDSESQLWDDWTVGHLRFRHMQNTSLNALFVDGHCESRKVGEVKVRDIVTNYSKH